MCETLRIKQQTKKTKKMIGKNTKLACGCDLKTKTNMENMKNLHAAVVFSQVNSLNSIAKIFSASTHFKSYLTQFESASHNVFAETQLFNV